MNELGTRIIVGGALTTSSAPVGLDPTPNPALLPLSSYHGVPEADSNQRGNSEGSEQAERDRGKE
jgi:hypothetical protein